MTPHQYVIGPMGHCLHVFFQAAGPESHMRQPQGHVARVLRQRSIINVTSTSISGKFALPRKRLSPGVRYAKGHSCGELAKTFCFNKGLTNSDSAQ